MSHYNQFMIKIDKDYAWLEYNDTVEACRCLNGAALKLYIYFNSFSPHEYINFSPKDFCEEMQLSPNSEKNAFRELIKYDFLKEESKNFFIFSPFSKNGIG